MKASKAIIECLYAENVNVIFGYPGGAVLPLYEALRESKIKHILVRNEQSAVHYASGYARESGKTGVCIATSGPGATNLITGIATAYMDSIPVVIITGQVNTDLIGTDAFQEADIKGATEPFTKHNYLVKTPNDLPKILKEAFYIASTGRKGPVLIDIPKNVQEAKIKFNYEDKVHITGYNPTYKGHKGQIKRVFNRIKVSKRPLIYAGGGLLAANAVSELRQFVDKTRIPVITSFMGIGSISQEHQLYAGIVGSHGYAYSNEIVSKSDLLISVGARMSNRATSNFYNLNPNIEFIHIDIDPAEIGKNITSTVPIVGDAKFVLSQLLQKNYELDISKWISEIKNIKSRFPISYLPQKNCNYINPKELFLYLSEKSNKNACIIADVGQNQIWAALYYNLIGNRKFMTSGGLGTMAYSLPAAAGVKLANPEVQVFSIIGDGGFQMCLGELAVITENKLDIKIILLNNNKLGMVRNLQHNAYGKNSYFGVDMNIKINFMKIAEAYGIKGFYVDSNKQFENALDKALKYPGPCLIECKIDSEFRVF